jgi:hypothetical protein
MTTVRDYNYSYVKLLVGMAAESLIAFYHERSEGIFLTSTIGPNRIINPQN